MYFCTFHALNYFTVMRKKISLVTLLAILMTVGVSALAQKPIPHASLEIKLPAEDDGYYFAGTNRILSRTGYAAAMYQVSYKVAPAAPLSMAKQFLSASKGTLGLTDNAINNDLVLHHSKTDDGGTVIRLRQRYKGLPVNKNAEITLHIDKNNMVDFVMNGFRPGIQLASVVPMVTTTAARQTVATHLGITGQIDFESNELMVLQHRGQHYLVHKVVIVCDEPVGEWEAFVDAQNGNLIKVEDLSAYHHDGRAKRKKRNTAPRRATVNGTGNIFNPDPLTTATAAYGGSYVDGTDANAAVLTVQLQNVTLLDITSNAGVFSLEGPYAVIQDFEAPNKGLFTQASSTFNFDRNADAFEAVNTYYHIDAAMRYLNTVAGVTVMPYQYTGGVRFDPSGLSGADNSHYVGATGRLAFGEGGVDDAEDADVIIHELGHGLHDWVTSGGLSQVNGLSEGTGDYFAGSYSRALGFWPAGTGNIAYNWTFNWDGHNPFWGGRALNYAAVYPTGLVNQIHTDGQIWATANMNIWDDIGRVKSDKVFWKGLGVTNSSTNQNDAANAVFTMSGTLGYTNAERLAIRNRYVAAGYTIPAVVLPVKVLGFSAEKNSNTVSVKWSVTNETPGNVYTIERAINGRDFTGLQNVNAIANGLVNAYAIVDNQPNDGINYYRLKETDRDGQVSYSHTIVINFGNKQLQEVYPNPAKGFVKLSSSGLKGATQLEITDASGKRLIQKQYNNATALTDLIDIGNLAAGQYQVRLINQGNVTSKRLTVVK